MGKERGEIVIRTKYSHQEKFEIDKKIKDNYQEGSEIVILENVPGIV